METKELPHHYRLTDVNLQFLVAVVYAVYRLLIKQRYI